MNRRTYCLLAAIVLAAVSCARHTRVSPAAATRTPAATEPAAPTLAFVNGRWFTGTGFARRTMYSVNGVFIAARPERIDSTLDLDGGYAVPPFADAHTHNLDGPTNLDTVRNAYVREGVFYVQVLTNSRARAAQVRDRFNRPCDLDVRYANGGLSSTLSHPFLAYEPRAMGLYDGSQWRTRAADIRKSRLRFGDAYWFLDSLTDVEVQWPRILAGQPDVIKIFLLDAREQPLAQPDSGLPSGSGLRPSLVPEIVRRAHAAGLRVAAHVETANDARIAVESGVDILAHLPGYELPFGADPRKYEIDSATARLAGRRGIVATPTLSLADIDDGSGPITAVAAARRRLQRENIRLLLASGVRIAVGSDWFGRTATKEFEELAATGLWSPLELIRLWGEETSLAVFPGRRIGRLEPGYEASFLVLRDDPSRNVGALRSISLRVKQGCVLDEAAPPVRSIAIIGASVLPMQPDTVLRDQTVVITDGTIQALGPRTTVPVPVGAVRVNGTGKYLIPGLWDMHVHLASRPDSALGMLRQATDVFLPLYVANGVIGVRDMGGDLDTLLALRRRIDSGSLIGPRVFVAGPSLTGNSPFAASWQWKLLTPDAGRRAVDSLKRAGVDHIKVYSFLARDVWLAIADQSKRLGLPFSGHIHASVRPDEAADFGQASIEHLAPELGSFCAPSGAELLQRAYTRWRAEGFAAFASGLAAIRAARDSVACAAIRSRFRANATAVDPTTVVTLIDSAALKRPGREYLPGTLRGDCVATVANWESVPDSIRRQYYAGLLSDVGVMHREGVRLLVGTDAPAECVVPGFSLHDEMANLVAAGVRAGEVLRIATLEAASFLGVSGRYGRIATGMAGDIVLLDANPNVDIRNTRGIAGIVLRGRWHSRGELDRWLAEVIGRTRP